MNDWYGAADVHSRMIFQAASFCNERSGHYDAFDQGLIFFLPNMTWYQPPAHAKYDTFDLPLREYQDTRNVFIA